MRVTLSIFIFLCVSNVAHAEISLCKESTVIHEPRDDVNYQSDAGLELPDPIMVPVTVDLLERYEIAVPDGVEAETYLGMMEIYKDGRILYNGVDISGDIKDVCEDGTSEFETEQ